MDEGLSAMVMVCLLGDALLRCAQCDCEKQSRVLRPE